MPDWSQYTPPSQAESAAHTCAAIMLNAAGKECPFIEGVGYIDPDTRLSISPSHEYGPEEPALIEAYFREHPDA